MNRRFLAEDCAVSGAFEMFAGRWTTQVLFCVHFGINRFGLIKKRLPRISDQILGLRLALLLENRLISRKKIGEEQVYLVTARGEALLKILDDLAQWHSR